MSPFQQPGSTPGGLGAPARVYPVAAEDRQSLLSRVLNLLGFAFVLTALGAGIGGVVGPAVTIPGLIATFVALIVLFFVKERTPLNLILLYTFATGWGLVLGPLLGSLVASGFGNVVIAAAAATGGVTLGAGAYATRTKRDLTGMGSILFIGLIAVLVASVVGIFVQLPLFQILIAAVAALLFTGFLIYDFNQAVKTPVATEGDAIMLAVNIYLDILNLFLNLLRLFLWLATIFGKSDD